MKNKITIATGITVPKRSTNTTAVRKESPRAHCGLFSKKDGAQAISEGSLNLHSSSLGDRDACARETNEALQKHRPATYTWEVSRCHQKFIRTSDERHHLIQELVTEDSLTRERDLKERFQTVLEELLSNAIYHGPKIEGKEKYSRREKIHLEPQERVTLRYSFEPKGIFLSVEDPSGTLELDHVIQAFSRCYGDESNQIETKESGAGLGLYMIYEMCTHVKIILTPNHSTEISCWLAKKASYDPDYFSFNFFFRRHRT